MKRLVGRLILFVFGWKTNLKSENYIKKCVMIAAPHTSNWDLVFAMAFYWKEGVESHFFIKDDWTKGIHGWFIRKMGGIGVTRGKKNNLVESAVKTFLEREEFILLVPAEATRKRVNKWKRGFYVIAEQAKVPVSLGYLDYKKKVAGLGPIINLTGDFESDMTKIQDFYKNINAKYPENYNPQIF
jgi:1-acyl-sn-glycerol-3-phosphate acyltransferase